MIAEPPVKENVETIATYQDLVRVFHAHPDWLQQFRQMVLTYDLIELPRKFDEFLRRDFAPLKASVDALHEQQLITNRRLDHLESDTATLKQNVAVLKQDVAVLKQDVAVLKQDVAVLKQDVVVLKQDVAVLKQDVAVLKQDVAVLKQEVAILKQDVEQLKHDVVILQERVDRMANEIAELKGNDFERTLREKAPARFARVLRRCRVLHHEQLADRLEEAIDAGKLDDKAFEDALTIDLVVSGQLKEDRRPVLLAVEASLTVDASDVERAARRADIIAAALGCEVIGVAFSKENITEGARTLAAECGVLLL